MKNDDDGVTPDDVLSRAADLMSCNDLTPEDLLNLSDSVPGDVVEEIEEPPKYAEKPKETLFEGDPSLPLKNPKHEAFLTRVASGASKYLAYMECVSPRCTKESAYVQASKLLAERGYRERLRFLARARSVEELQRSKNLDPEVKREWTREEMFRFLEGILRGATNKSEQIAAWEKLFKYRFLPDGDPNKPRDPDPAWLCAYFNSARRQGLTAEEIEALARQAAGLGEKKPEAVKCDSGTFSGGEPGPEIQDVVFGAKSPENNEKGNSQDVQVS